MLYSKMLPSVAVLKLHNDYFSMKWNNTKKHEHVKLNLLITYAKSTHLLMLYSKMLPSVIVLKLHNDYFSKKWNNTKKHLQVNEPCKLIF